MLHQDEPFFYYTRKLANNDWFWYGYLIGFGLNIAYPSGMSFLVAFLLIPLGYARYTDP